MDIEEFRRANTKIRNSFAAVKRDMLFLRKEITEIRENIVQVDQEDRIKARRNMELVQEFDDKIASLTKVASTRLDDSVRSIKELDNQIVALKEDLDTERVQNKKIINKLTKNLESFYPEVDSYRKEAETLRNENKKFRMLIETLMQEMVQNKDISVRTLKNILDELKIEASGLKEGVIKLRTGVRGKAGAGARAGRPSTRLEFKPEPLGLEFRPRRKNIFSRIIDYFAEE